MQHHATINWNMQPETFATAFGKNIGCALPISLDCDHKLLATAPERWILHGQTAAFATHNLPFVSLGTAGQMG
jgi:hypothetical protein